MASQLKYYSQFVSLDNKLNRVELWQNTEAVLIAEEVTMCDMPFSKDLPNLDDKFQVVRGTGCEINLLSDTDMRFFNGLYHTDKMEFLVKHYIDEAINWLGYLNSEMMRESYSDSFNYPVQVAGNDGFSLMDRIQFVQDDATHFIGIKSKYELIQIIFEKIKLPFQECLISLSTTFPGYSNGAESTILHESYIDCANFYNEDGDAETLRKVLESIHAPYGAFITQRQGNIVITDIHTLAQGAPITFKRFALPHSPIEPIVQVGLTGELISSGGGTGGTIQTDTIALTGNCGSVVINFDGSSTILEYWYIQEYINSNPPHVNAINGNDVTLSLEDGVIKIRGPVDYVFSETTTVLNYYTPPPIIASNYIGVVEVNFVKTLAQVGYSGTGQEAERSGGKNKQVVSYSPYPIKEYITNSVSSLSEFELMDGEWSSRNNFLYKTLYQNKYWNGPAEVTKFSQSPISHVVNYAALPAFGVDNTTYITDDTLLHYRWNGYLYLVVDSSILWGSDENIHMRILYSETNVLSLKYRLSPVLVLPKSEYAGVGQGTKIVSGSALLLTGKFGIITHHNLYQGHELASDVTNIYLTLKIKVGDKYYNGLSWVTTPSFYKARCSQLADATFATNIDTWNQNLKNDVTMINIGNNGVNGLFIPINSDLSGILEVEFWSNFGVDNFGFSGPFHLTENTDLVNEAWINNISIKAVMPDGSEISNSDIEYIGYLDPKLKDEAKKVELICGTETSISDRAKILYLTDGIYKPVKQWTRANQTFKIEQLLLNSLSSNFRAGYITLNNLKLKNGFDQLTVLTDEAIFPGKKFMVKSATVNYRDDQIECALVEISPDELTIEPL